MASLIPNGKQAYTDGNGAPLVGGLVYTYEAGTTVLKTTYTTAAATTANANPVPLDARGEASIFWDGNYKVKLTTAAGVEIWTQDNVTDGFSGKVSYVALADDTATTGAGLVGFLYAAAYGAGTLGRWLQDLATSVGSSFIGFIQSGTGAVLMTVESMLRGTVDPRQFGAVLDGTTDDTAAFQRAINCRGFDRSVHIKLPSGYPGAKIAGTLYLPSLVTIDLNGTLLYGDGTNTMFETGYWLAGAVVSNHAQANETAIVYSSSVINGGINNCDRAFKLFNFCEDSRIENIRCTGVNQTLYAKRCFYGSFRKIMTRAPLNGALYPCYHVSDAVNAIGLEQVYTTGFTTAWLIDGSKDNFSAFNCGAEGCTIGVQVDGTSYGMKFDGWYFENLTTALSFSAGSGHENVDIANCFFNTVTTAITASTITSGVFRHTNRLNGAAVSLGTALTNKLRVEIPNDVTALAAISALPSNYSIGTSATTDYIKGILDNTNVMAAKARVHNGVIPFEYGGNSGVGMADAIPFCVCTLLSASLTIDTLIAYRASSAIFFQVDVLDSAGLNSMVGQFGGLVQMSMIKPGAITVTASNNGGLYRFVITGLVTATSFSGFVRIL